ILRGQPVPRPPRVLQLPWPRNTDPPPREAPGVPRGASGTHHELTRDHPGAVRHLHALADAARSGLDRARHRVARRLDQVGAPGGARCDTEGEASSYDAQEGAKRMSKVRLGIVGVGNCASALLQGLEYYKDASAEDA